MILNLPVEILKNIYNFLTNAEYYNLMLTHRNFNILKEFEKEQRKPRIIIDDSRNMKYIARKLYEYPHECISQHIYSSAFDRDWVGISGFRITEDIDKVDINGFGFYRYNHTLCRFRNFSTVPFGSLDIRKYCKDANLMEIYSDRFVFTYGEDDKLTIFL